MTSGVSLLNSAEITNTLISFVKRIECMFSFPYNDNQEAVLFGIACFGLGKSLTTIVFLLNRV